MKKILSLVAIVMAAATLAPAAAEAYPYGYGWGGGGNWHHGYYRPYNGFGVVVGVPADPYYYPPAAVPVYAAPVPVYPAAPVPTYPAPVAAPASAPQANGYCREFTRDVNIGGRSQSAYGTACQQPDGSWQFVN